jgi:CBS domain-containing protein
VGVISEKEILRDLIENQKDPAKTAAKDLQYTPLVVIHEGESVTDALKMIPKTGASRIAVVKNGQLVGMLTQKAVADKEDLAVKTKVPKKTVT